MNKFILVAFYPMLSTIIVQVDLFDVSDTYKVWSVLPEEEDISMEKLPVKLSASEPVIFSVPDPRLASFSHRLLLLQGISGRST